MDVSAAQREEKKNHAAKPKAEPAPIAGYTIVWLHCSDVSF